MLLQPSAPKHSESSADPWAAAMAIGDFQAAWRESDRVLAQRDRATRDDSLLPYHLRWVWDGRPFDGRRVVVRCYHGLGDTLQFCRFLGPLRHRAKHLTVEVQPELIDLLGGLEGPDLLVPFRPERPLPQSDCDLEIMELAHALRLQPTLLPYLSAPNPQHGPKFRVGLCWQSSPTWLPERSLPSTLLLPLVARPNIEFISLQRGAFPLPNLLDDCPKSITETANRIAGLDLVITVDTMVAHLAGALGIPLWLLLKAEPDWRWLAGGTGSVWYANVRKYRQPRAGDWGPVLANVSADLTEVTSMGTLQRRGGS